MFSYKIIYPFIKENIMPIRVPGMREGEIKQNDGGVNSSMI
jgi:hypothetical protein